MRRADGERLGHVDLHVVDVAVVPDRLEQAVGEAEGEDVECRFLSEEVVDAVDLLLGEGAVQRRVEVDGAGQVGAEGLLDDDPRALGQAGLAEEVDDAAGRARRHAQVVQPPGSAAELPFGVCDGRPQPGGAGHRADVDEGAGEGLPLAPR